LFLRSRTFTTALWWRNVTRLFVNSLAPPNHLGYRDRRPRSRDAIGEKKS
jgi:hypothetical protein